MAAAFLLNGLALGAFATAVKGWHVPVGTSRQTVSIATFTVTRTLPETANAVLPTRTQTTAEPNSVPSAAPPPRVDETASLKAPPSARDGGSAVRFYRLSEVDQPAEPDSDWNLDTAVLDAAGVERLVFEVFIDRNGEVVGSTILEPTTLEAQARQTIEDRLRQTLLQPAIRDGSTVASVRRIEVSTVTTGP